MPSSLLWFITLTSALVTCAACAPTDSAPNSSMPPVHDGGADTPDDDDKDEACEEGQQRACPCSDGTSGTKTCHDGSYETCLDCVAEVSSDGLCVPGVYVGKSMGNYAGGGAFMGLIPGWKAETMDRFALTLTTEGSGEFPTINSGCIRARLPDGGVDPKAGGLLNGTVDCTTGKLDGELRNFGTRNNAITGEPERFYARGVVHATYDAAKGGFNGTWEQHEPPDFFGMIAGGGGTLSVARADDSSEDTDTSGGTSFQECWGFDFPDNLFPDAGP